MIPETLHAFADAWAAAMIRAAWQGAAVILVVLVITRASPAIPPAWRGWLWRGALAKLVLALAIGSAIAVPLLPAPSPVISGSQVAGTFPRDETEATPSPSAEVLLSGQNNATEVALPKVTWTSLLFSLWVSGVLVSVVRMVRDHARVARLRRGARPVTDSSVLEACADLSRRLGLARAPDLLASSELEVPVLVGVLRPAIVLPVRSFPPTEVGRPAAGAPTGASAPESLARIRMMLAHELAHLARRDLAWNWLPASVLALFYFHPLAWLAARELRLAQESACDALAMSVTGTAPRSYGAMLLDVIAGAGASGIAQRRSLPRTLSAAVVETRSSVERRLAAMTHFRPVPASGRARFAGAALVLALLALAVVPWKLVAQSAPRAEGSDPAGGTNPTATTAGATAPAAGGDAAPTDLTGPGAPRDPNVGDPFTGALGKPPARGATGNKRRYEALVKAPSVDLGVNVGGVVAEVGVEEGDAVRKGQLLVSLDDTSAKAAVVEAQAFYELKKVQVKRASELSDQRNISVADVDEARADLRVAEARLMAAEHTLARTRITAPFDGVVSDLPARPGMLVKNDSVLATVIDTSALSVAAHVPQNLIPRLKIGQGVRVTIDAVPDETFEGKIAFVSPTVLAGSGTVAVTVRLADTQGKVRPGMAGWIELEQPK